MKKLLSLVLALMMLASIAVVAHADDEPITLVFLNQTNTWTEPMQKMADMYEEYTNGRVKVVLEGYSFNDLFNMIEVKIGAKPASTEYDILSIDVPNVASYGRREMLAPLDEYFTEEDRANLLPAAIEAGSYNGQFLAAPLCTSAQILYYNPDLLTAEEIAEIEAATVENRLTWERVAEIAEAAMKRNDPDGTNGIWGLDFQQVSRVYQMNQLANSMGGKQVDETGYSLAGVIDTDSWKAALAWYQGLVEKGVCSKGVTADQIGNYFYSGKLVFMIGTTEIPTIAGNNNMPNIAWTPSPVFAGHEADIATATGSWHYGVNAASEHVKEAAEFVHFLTTNPEATETFYQMKGNFPAYIPLLDKLGELDTTPGYMKIAFYEAVNTAYPRALTPAFSEYSAIINALWEDVRNGEDIDEVISDSIDEYASQCVKYQQ